MNKKLFKDLVEFARIEQESGDLEPWAELLSSIRDPQNEETSLWLVCLYNTYDSMSSAWNVYRRWPSLKEWAHAKDYKGLRDYPCMQERRNLHGGRVITRMTSYWEQCSEWQGEQEAWLMTGFDGDHGELENFVDLMQHVKQVWGVGRQAAFEWVEFLGKVNEFPVSAPDACLWESSGPRQSLETLYGRKARDVPELDEWANEVRDKLMYEGVDLLWEDFETVICDFKVMQRGRYYPGRHLAALRGEIEELKPDDREFLLDQFQAVIPYPWNEIPPGINKEYMPVYKETGKMVDGYVPF